MAERNAQEIPHSPNRSNPSANQTDNQQLHSHVTKLAKPNSAERCADREGGRETLLTQ